MPNSNSRSNGGSVLCLRLVNKENVDQDVLIQPVDAGDDSDTDAKGPSFHNPFLTVTDSFFRARRS